MFRICKIYDDVSRANREAIAQLVKIMRGQFPLAAEADIQKLFRQLQDPLKYRYRTILFMAEDSRAQVRGFAVLLHRPDFFEGLWGAWKGQGAAAGRRANFNAGSEAEAGR